MFVFHHALEDLNYRIKCFILCSYFIHNNATAADANDTDATATTAAATDATTNATTDATTDAAAASCCFYWC